MSHTADILDGLGLLIAAAGIADYPWSGGTPVNGAVVTFKDMPATPDRVVVLTPFGASNDQPVTTLGRQGVQVWCRGVADDARDVDDLGDSLFDLLHGLAGRTFGSVHLVQCLRESSLPRGMDEARRWMRSDNFYLDVDLPVTANRPY